MVAYTRLIAPAVVRAYDFAGCRRIIDVGGGYGELLIAILQAHPTACGVLVNRQHAIEQGRQYLERAALAHRCECIAGDFFEAVPGGVAGGYHLSGQWSFASGCDAATWVFLA